MGRFKGRAGFLVDEEPPEPEKAVHSGTCPVCHVFIAKNHSWIRRLPRPLAPQVDWNGAMPYSAVTGKLYHSAYNGHLRMHPRWKVHEYCWNVAARILDSEMLGTAAIRRE